MKDLSLYAYLIASVCFILSIRGLSSPNTAHRGNLIGIIGMAIVIITTILKPEVVSYAWILIALVLGGLVGSIISLKIKMTALPQLMALFHSFVGLAAVFISTAAYLSPQSYGIELDSFGAMLELSLGMVIGAITFTGSVIAFMKLQGIFPKGKWLVFKNQLLVSGSYVIVTLIAVILFCFNSSPEIYILLVLLGLFFGILAVCPIGGADMPVVVSVLNSYSGWAACGIGFTLSNPVLIITGSLVGASGAILSYIMSKNMNRSILSVLMGGFGGETASANSNTEDDRAVKQAFAEDAAFFMKNARNVIVVPGYGMAVAHAQHALKELVQKLKANSVNVKFAIHPVAGRMPGHMNVLLAEANVDYDDVFELEDINNDFATTDVALVIGANDVTNPAAKTDPTSPIFGMPILEVQNAGQIFFIKRSMAAGYAGVQNELFYLDKTLMIFGDAKEVCEGIFKAME